MPTWDQITCIRKRFKLKVNKENRGDGITKTWEQMTVVYWESDAKKVGKDLKKKYSNLGEN